MLYLECKNDSLDKACGCGKYPTNCNSLERPRLDCEEHNLTFKVQPPLHYFSFLADISYQKLAAHYIGRELRDADEDNLLDEEDMHIFGLSPMTDPLDLVCCNACKKPIKASRYAAHAELCKSLSSTAENNLELDGPAVTRKPPRKERKKSQITQTKKATSLRESKKSESAKTGDIAAPEIHMDEKIQMSSFIEAHRDTHLNAAQKMNGSTANPYHMNSSKHGTKRSWKPLKRTAAESPSNPGAKNLCKTTAKVPPYVPAPIATKIYYSQRGNNLRSAISRMFFEEPGKDSSNEVPCFNVLQVNVAPERVACEQRDDKVLHLAQTPDQIITAKSNFDMSNSVASLTSAAQLPVNNTLEPQYISNSYSFADKPGEPPGSLEQGSGIVPVV